MKNFLILVMALIGITSCSKDSFDPAVSLQNVPEKSEIMVGVTYLVWTGDQCTPGCSNSESQEVSYIANARITLYPGGDATSDASEQPIMELTTNSEGTSLIEDLQPGEYTVMVETELGQKTRSTITQLGKRSYVDFSF